MSLLGKLFGKKTPELRKPSGEIKSSGELIAEVSDGANLVEGKQTWEHAEDKKHDIEYMKKCCDAELATMNKTGLAPAPYYFERVAILSRKAKNYEQEVIYCEKYIEAIEHIYRTQEVDKYTNLRARYINIAKRLPKAKELLAKAVS